MRRSSRPRIRPLEFWNFEQADYSVSQDISYKLSRDVSTSVLNSTKVKNPKRIDNRSKPDGINSDSSKTDTSKRKKQVEEDEELPSVTRTEEYKSRFNLKSPRVVVKKLKTHQARKEAQNKHSSEAESNDSGITDLDTTSAQSVVLDTRLTEFPADISSIHLESESFLKTLSLCPTSTQKSGQNKEISYSRTRKSLMFKDAVSSTTVSEENVNECFKVPLPRPKKFKKSLAVEPVLGSIVEEREDENMELDGSNQETTPKKSSALLRSRILNLEFDEDAISQTNEEVRADECDDNAVSQQMITGAISDEIPASMSTTNKRASSNSRNVEDNPSNKVSTEVSLSSVKRGSKKMGESLQEANVKAKSDASVSTVSKKNRRQVRQSSDKQKEEEKSNTVARIINKRGGKKNDTISTDFSIHQTICPTAEIVKRSGRIRKKPLEFWNFETAEVKTLANGEVSLVYTKRIDPSSEVNTTKKGVPLHPAIERTDKNKLPSAKHLPVDQLSPTKRKLFTPETNTLDSAVELYESPVLIRRKSFGRLCTCDSEEPPDFTEFKSLRFREWETDEFKCYMARNYWNHRNQIYSGFLFLERGEMMWITKKITTLFVICGKGTLKVLHSPTEGEEIVLEEKVKTTIPVDKKVLLEISDGSDMLRLFMALQKVSSSTSPS